MNDARLGKLLALIDRNNARVEEAIDRIERSRHPQAAAIAEELRDQCLALASARAVASDYWPGQPEAVSRDA